MSHPRWKSVLIAACAAAATVRPASADLEAARAAYAKLLAKYVTSSGVHYDAWRANGNDVKTLSEVLTVYRSTDPASLEPEARKALYINLYNAKVVEIVLEGNPKDSIRDLSRRLNPNEIFSRRVVAIEGKPLSLNDLETRLWEEFKDPRIHFALNLATKSCPPIYREPYQAGQLDGQLDDATRRYLASPGALVVRTSGGRTTVTTARIFDWYASEFKPAGGVAAFLERFGPEEASAALRAAGGTVRFEFSDYDWSLNTLR